MSIAKKRTNINNMLTKKIWLLIGALAVLSAGVIGINAYLSKKSLLVIETPEKTIVEPITQSEEFTSVESEETNQTPEIDTSDWKTYRDEEHGYELRYPYTILHNDKRIDYYGKQYVAFYYFLPDVKIPSHMPYPFNEGMIIRKAEIGIGNTSIQDIHNLEKLKNAIREEASVNLECEKVVIGEDIKGLRVDRSTNKYLAYDFYIPQENKIIIITFASCLAGSPETFPFKQILHSFTFVD